MTVWNLAKHPTRETEKDKGIEDIQKIMNETNLTWKSWSEFLEDQKPFHPYPTYRGKIGATIYYTYLVLN